MTRTEIANFAARNDGRITRAMRETLDNLNMVERMLAEDRKRAENLRRAASLPAPKLGPKVAR